MYAVLLWEYRLRPGIMDEHRTFTMNKTRDLTHLSQPVWVGQREVGEGPLPLDKVPGGADVVVPRYDPLHRVSHQVDVDRVRQVEPAATSGIIGSFVY